MKIRLGKRTVMIGTAMTIVIAGIALALVGAGGIVAWEYSNSNAFCTNHVTQSIPRSRLRMRRRSTRASTASSATWDACRPWS